MNDRTAAERAAHELLALGDSYTVGEGVREAESWPARVAARLRARGIAVGPPRIVARTGWTAAELEAGLDAGLAAGAASVAGDKAARGFDVVSLLVGVNDQYRGVSVDDYVAVLRRLVARGVALACAEPSRLLVVSIPDWGVTPFAEGRDRARIGREIDAFNIAAAAVARAAGARWVDVTPLSRAFGADLRALAADRLHPSGEQYAAWADRILPAAVRALAP